MATVCACLNNKFKLRLYWIIAVWNVSLVVRFEQTFIVGVPVCERVCGASRRVWVYMNDKRNMRTVLIYYAITQVNVFSLYYDLIHSIGHSHSHIQNHIEIFSHALRVDEFTSRRAIESLFYHYDWIDIVYCCYFVVCLCIRQMAKTKICLFWRKGREMCQTKTAKSIFWYFLTTNHNNWCINQTVYRISRWTVSISAIFLFIGQKLIKSGRDHVKSDKIGTF